MIGIIALTQGMNIAIESACIQAPNSGKNEGVNPISSVNITLYIYDRIGIDTINPAIIDGKTKHID